MLLVVIVCIALGYWQLRRGEAGNLRSYAYALEWPFFAAAAGYMWWRTMREDCEDMAEQENPRNVDGGSLTDPPPQLPRSTAALTFHEVEPDPELDAYNAYLADLHRNLEQVSPEPKAITR